MTPEQHRRQRDDVRRSLVATDDGRACMRNAYARHPLSRAVPQGTASVGSVAQSVRELGEMLAAADALPVYYERLAELERLGAKAAQYVEQLRRLVDHEFADAMGAPVVDDDSWFEDGRG